MKKDELRRTVERGLGGMPEVKATERKKWLGEFRERVILGLTLKQCREEQSLHYVREVLKDSMADKLIVNNKIPMSIISKYMRLANEMEKDFISRVAQCEDAMGVVVASTVAIERENIDLVKDKLPIKFISIKGKKICQNCSRELYIIAPEHVENFTKITFLDKILGIECAACQK
ncbi:MAG: YueI family protein [Clostridiales bacterium]|nr:YueI family protein [Clostridiales bacterium]